MKYEFIISKKSLRNTVRLLEELVAWDVLTFPEHEYRKEIREIKKIIEFIQAIIDGGFKHEGLEPID